MKKLPLQNLAMDTDPQARTQYEIIAGDGEIYGPYSLEDLQQYLDEERVQWDTQVRLPGTDDWMPIIRLISPPEFETTAATTTEYEPLVDGGSADINVMDALKKGGASAKYGGCYWSVYCVRIVVFNIRLFGNSASTLGRTDGRGIVYIFVKSDPR